MSSRARIVLLACMLLPLPSLHGRQAAVPDQLTELLNRAQQLRAHLAAGRMLEALDFVLPAKRNDVLAAGKPPYSKPRIVGVDLTEDENRVLVRVQLEAPAVDASGASRTAWTARDNWVRVGDDWFFAPAEPDDLWNLRAGEPGPTADPEEVKREFDELFDLVDQVIDVGELDQGEHRELPVRVAYTGTVPLRITSPFPNPLLIVERATADPFRPGAARFDLVLNAGRWSGPFRFPFPLDIEYKGVSFRRSIVVLGSVFAPFSLTRAEVDGAGSDDLYFTLTNNTDGPVQVLHLNVDDRLWIEPFEKSVPPSGETTFHLRRKDGVAPPSELTVVFSEPIRGTTDHSFPLDLSSP